jgi:shikimate kinase
MDSFASRARGRLASGVFLVGFMGCGKSTTGPVLAARLKRPFIDLDRLIEARTGRTVPELIFAEGEPQFRRLETEALRASCWTKESVVALGGGAFISGANRNLIARSGVSIWLDAPFELCWRRISADRTCRPFAPDESSAYLRYEQRLAHYETSTFRVAIEESFSPDQTALLILDLLNEGKVSNLPLSRLS